MTVVKALACAAKLKAGQKCSMSETAAALDTLAWAYKQRLPAKRAAKRTATKRARGARKNFRRIYNN